MNLKTTLSLFFIPCFCFLANSQIINQGQFKIAASTTVYFQEDYTNATTGNHVSEGDFYLNSNFINHGITSADDGTTYFKSATNSLLTLTGDSQKVNFYNVEIDVTAPNKKGVSVAHEFSLQVANALHFKSGDLRLIGDSQLIQGHSGINTNTVVSGKLLIDQQGTSSVYQYDYWSSPVNNGGSFTLMGGLFDGTDAVKNSFDPTQILFNSGSPYNGMPSDTDVSGNVTKALTINQRWLYKYVPSPDSYSKWIKINSTTSLSPGEGYTMKGTNTASISQNYVYHGAPNNGDYNFAITSGESVLLGNPYPSALDATKFLNDNNTVTGQMTFWVDGGSTSHYLSDYLGGYAIRNLTGGTPPSIASPLISGIGNAGSVTAPTQFVPVGKGFFVDAISTGTIVFNNSQRAFKVEGSRPTAENKYIRIGFEGPEGFHRQLLLGFLPNSPADLGYNVGYDGVDTTLRKDDVFFMIDDDAAKNYMIQGVNAYSNTMEFPLGMVLSESGKQQLMLDAVENFTDLIYVKDKVLNITHNLSDSNLEINLPAGKHLDRYSLVFKPTETLSSTSTELDLTTVFYNGKQQLVVTKPMHLDIKSIDIYNVLGQHVLSYSENLNQQNKIHIPFSENQGVYLVVLNTAHSKKSTKILKY